MQGIPISNPRLCAARASQSPGHMGKRIRDDNTQGTKERILRASPHSNMQKLCSGNKCFSPAFDTSVYSGLICQKKFIVRNVRVSKMGSDGAAALL